MVVTSVRSHFPTPGGRDDMGDETASRDRWRGVLAILTGTPRKIGNQAAYNRGICARGVQNL
ncbi:MAG: hypothetical protein DMG30_28660 [Acidobacteria bacterium]|nr:MAG: hypothetical protein DMG30_28660 [Acidobacteriota bacterium]